MKSTKNMNAVLKKNQYYVVSGLKRYREVLNQKMLLAQQDMRSSPYVIARQKKKIYETLVSMVIHEGVDETIEFALKLYAKLPHHPIKAKETIKACEQALESFFLLTDVNPYVQKLYDQQRSATVHGLKASEEIDEQISEKHITEQTIPSVTSVNKIPPTSYTDTLSESYEDWGSSPSSTF